VVGQLSSSCFLTAMGSGRGCVLVSVGVGVIILVAIILEPFLVLCFTIFFCSIGWEVPVGGVMVGCLVLVKICL